MYNLLMVDSKESENVQDFGIKLHIYQIEVFY